MSDRGAAWGSVRALHLPAALMAALLIGPIVVLVLGSSVDEIRAGLAHPSFWPALGVSARTSATSLVVLVLLGLPLAGWLATSPSWLARWVEVAVDLPIVLPPAVLGVALLRSYGRGGLLGPALAEVGIELPFSGWAVVMAQVVVSGPFFVQSATAALRRVDPDLVLVARTLGRGPTATFFRVALPLAAPGMLTGASLAWARAVGEFGATLLFAGNRVGVTQTMPLAIFTALESDVRAALALSLVLAALATLVLAGLRAFGEGRTR